MRILLYYRPLTGCKIDSSVRRTFGVTPIGYRPLVGCKTFYAIIFGIGLYDILSSPFGVL